MIRRRSIDRQPRHSAAELRSNSRREPAGLSAASSAMRGQHPCDLLDQQAIVDRLAQDRTQQPRVHARDVISGDVDNLQITPPQPRHPGESKAIDAVWHHDIHQQQIERLVRSQEFSRAARKSDAKTTSVALVRQHLAQRLTEASRHPRQQGCEPCQRSVVWGPFHPWSNRRRHDI